jgi:hypothetical protein
MCRLKSPTRAALVAARDNEELNTIARQLAAAAEARRMDALAVQPRANTSSRAQALYQPPSEWNEP